ncbi:MAG: hypothetical protein O7C59_08685, partial [Rickettsia endosymbiont of Ixodes persulcatus]|nr:hypothetical protein [Rickettsia endosymbiont of Ixodes persulcatus]
ILVILFASTAFVGKLVANTRVNGLPDPALLEIGVIAFGCIETGNYAGGLERFLNFSYKDALDELGTNAVLKFKKVLKNRVKRRHLDGEKNDLENIELDICSHLIINIMEKVLKSFDLSKIMSDEACADIATKLNKAGTSQMECQQDGLTFVIKKFRYSFSAFKSINSNIGSFLKTVSTYLDTKPPEECPITISSNSEIFRIIKTSRISIERVTKILSDLNRSLGSKEDDFNKILENCKNLLPSDAILESENNLTE